MGTNYYTEAPKGYEEKELHIGKSSGGWCFSLHVIPELKLTTWEAWKDYLRKRPIWDEYENSIPFKELEKVVTERQGVLPDVREYEKGDHPYYASAEDFYTRNYAQPGPNGLVRTKIGEHCVGHGEGTWDYIEGEFS